MSKFKKNKKVASQPLPPIYDAYNSMRESLYGNGGLARLAFGGNLIDRNISNPFIDNLPQLATSLYAENQSEKSGTVKSINSLMHGLNYFTQSKLDKDKLKNSQEISLRNLQGVYGNNPYEQMYNQTQFGPGGQVKQNPPIIYTDPIAYNKAAQNYNDSLALYNYTKLQKKVEPKSKLDFLLSPIAELKIKDEGMAEQKGTFESIIKRNKSVNGNIREDGTRYGNSRLWSLGQNDTEHQILYEEANKIIKNSNGRIQYSNSAGSPDLVHPYIHNSAMWRGYGNNNDYSNTYPKQPVKYQPQRTVNTTKGKVTGTVKPNQVKGSQLVNITQQVNTPKHPVNNMKRLSIQNQMLDNNSKIQGQPIPIQPMQLPQQGSIPFYGPGNTIVGYTDDNRQFYPAQRYTGAENNQIALQDKELLNNPELLKKYVKSKDNYKFGNGGKTDKNTIYTNPVVTIYPRGVGINSNPQTINNFEGDPSSYSGVESWKPTDLETLNRMYGKHLFNSGKGEYPRLGYDKNGNLVPNAFRYAESDGYTGAFDTLKTTVYNPKLNGNTNLQGKPIALSKFGTDGIPFYGPGNTIVGYTDDNRQFYPAQRYTGAPNNQSNLQDKELLDNPELLKKYVQSKATYKFGNGGKTDVEKFVNFLPPAYKDYYNNNREIVDNKIIKKISNTPLITKKAKQSIKQNYINKAPKSKFPLYKENDDLEFMGLASVRQQDILKNLYAIGEKNIYPKNTPNNFGNTGRDDTLNYLTSLKMLDKYGKPYVFDTYNKSVPESLKKLSKREKGNNSFYIQDYNTMFLDNYSTDYVANSLLAELSHSYQNKNDLYKNYEKNDSLSGRNLSGNDYDNYMYNTPGTIEYDAHELIQPNLTNEFIKIKDSIKNNYPKFASGGLINGSPDIFTLAGMQDPFSNPMQNVIQNQGVTEEYEPVSNITEEGKEVNIGYGPLPTIKNENITSSTFKEPNLDNFKIKNTVAVRHNNPGNLKFEPWMKKYGAVQGDAAKIDNKRFKDKSVWAKFPTVEQGLKARMELLFERYPKNMNVETALRRYSGSDYGSEIYPELSKKTLGQLTEQEKLELTKRQIVREDKGMYKILKDKKILAMGGSIQDVFKIGQPNVEVEGKENILLPNGLNMKVTGDSHAEGGIDMQLPSNSFVFSEKLKVPKELTSAILNKDTKDLTKAEKKYSFSDLANKFNTEEDMKNLNKDKYANMASKLNLQNKNTFLENIKIGQEMYKQSKGIKNDLQSLMPKFDNGGNAGESKEAYRERMLKRQAKLAEQRLLFKDIAPTSVRTDITKSNFTEEELSRMNEDEIFQLEENERNLNSNSQPIDLTSLDIENTSQEELLKQAQSLGVPVSQIDFTSLDINRPSMNSVTVDPYPMPSKTNIDNLQGNHIDVDQIYKNHQDMLAKQKRALDEKNSWNTIDMQGINNANSFNLAMSALSKIPKINYPIANQMSPAPNYMRANDMTSLYNSNLNNQLGQGISNINNLNLGEVEKAALMNSLISKSTQNSFNADISKNNQDINNQNINTSNQYNANRVSEQNSFLDKYRGQLNNIQAGKEQNKNSMLQDLMNFNSNKAQQEMNIPLMLMQNNMETYRDANGNIKYRPNASTAKLIELLRAQQALNPAVTKSAETKKKDS